MKPAQILLLAIVTCVPACQPVSPYVYIPVSPPEVTLHAHASESEVATGIPGVLHGERRYRARWRRVARKTLATGRCWVARPPPAREREVADNLQWRAVPMGSARFNAGMRYDHARTVTFARAGTYVLYATTPVWCGAAVTAAPITIKVSA